MQNYIINFLTDLLDNKKAAKTFPQAYMQFFGLVICAVIVVTIVVIALIFPKSTLGYTTVLILVLLANFLLKPRLMAKKFKPPKTPLNNTDVLMSYFLIAATILVGIHLLNLFQTLGQWEWVDKIIYWVAIVIILEGVRRLENRTPVFFFMTWGFIIFYFLAPDDTHIFYDHDAGIFSTKGVYGEALATVVDVVYAFIFLSFAFHLIQINKLLNYFAFKITDGRRSGVSSAKYAIWASTFYGAISGGPQDNVNETGKNTIPMMKPAGYPEEFSASVIATSASIGQLVPPIMGIVAFLIVEISDFSYLEVMLAAIVPAFLFLFSLMVAVILEVKVLNLEPLNLHHTTEQMKSQDNQIDRQIKHQLTALVIGFLVLFAMLIMEVSLARCALSASAVVVMLAYLLPSLRPNKRQLLGFIINSGKDGLNVALSCAAIGIILFVFKQTVAEQQITDFLISLSNSPQWFWFWKLMILLVFATLPLALGMLLPTLAVFLIMVFMTVPVLKEIGIPELHAYLFVFCYSVLASITPPYAPLLDKAAKIVKINNKKKLYQTTFRLSMVAFVLPLAWIYHPEMIFDTTQFSLSNVTQTIYVALAFMLAIVAISAALFGVFRSSLSTYQRLLLVISGILIALPYLYLMLLGVIIASVILISNDWKYKTSALRPTFDLVGLVIRPKNISFSLWLILASLTFVYIALFTTNGLVYYLNAQSVSPWLKERFHFTLSVEDCHLETSVLEKFLRENGYESTVICSRFAELSVTKLSPGEVRLGTKVNAVEFDEAYFRQIPELKNSLRENYEQDVLSELGSCLETVGEPLKKQHFNPNNLTTSTDCYQSPLPVVYIGSELVDLLDAETGALVHLHDGVFVESLPEDIQSNPNQHFVVASWFNTRFSDLDHLLIGPSQFLSKIFPEDEGIEYKLIVKIHQLPSLEILETILALLETDQLQEKLPYRMDISIIDHKIWKIQGLFLTGIQTISMVVLLICLLVLLSGMSQLLEKNRKLLALLRINGLQSEAQWIFVLSLSIIEATIPCVLAFILSNFLSGFIAFFSEKITYYTINFSVFFTVFGITLVAAVLTTVILTKIYLLRDLAKELTNYASSNN